MYGITARALLVKLAATDATTLIPDPSALKAIQANFAGALTPGG
jgi:hypothetical protein